jgi:hypothetical protein
MEKKKATITNKRTGGEAYMVDHLPSKYEALSLNPSAA